MSNCTPLIPLCNPKSDTEWLRAWIRALELSGISAAAQRWARECLVPYFATYGRESRTIFRNRGRMAEKLGCSVRTISRYIAEVCKTGLLERRQKLRSRCNTFIARFEFVRTKRKPPHDGQCPGQCPGGVDKSVNHSLGSVRNQTVVVSPSAEENSYADVITYRCETDSETRSGDVSGGTLAIGGDVRPIPSNEVSSDSEAPPSWPERPEVAPAERLASSRVEEASRAFRLPRRLALYLATRYSAEELAWLLEAASTARAPIAMLRALAKRLTEGEAGPGIDHRKPTKSSSSRRPTKSSRSRVDLAELYRGAHWLGDRRDPDPPPPLEPEPTPDWDAWPAYWSALDIETREHIDELALTTARGSILELLRGAAPEARERTIASRRWNTARELGLEAPCTR